MSSHFNLFCVVWLKQYLLLMIAYTYLIAIYIIKGFSNNDVSYLSYLLYHTFRSTRVSQLCKMFCEAEAVMELRPTKEWTNLIVH